jgi:hypothetical protein
MKKEIIFLTYIECKEWVKKNLPKIKTRFDWKKTKYDLPNYIPINPREFYKTYGWISWDDFLGKKIKSNFLNYIEAKKWVHENLDLNKINTKDKWGYNAWQLPDFIPKTPDKFYRFTGWTDWYEWLEKKY